jgi:selenocysteine lyase/cysteine desulfurase
MGVLYGRYDLLDRLTAYKVRPAPQDSPGKFETGTGNFEGVCGVLGALEYIEWVGETFWEEHKERYAGEYSYRRLSFKLGMSAIRSYEFELSHALLDFLADERDGANIYVWDGNYYALAVTEHLGAERSGGMVRVGPVPQNRLLSAPMMRSLHLYFSITGVV